ncbi:MAG: hypothetical protein RBS39_03530 [Phycisphaerales bacterium]|nr:hypothetical protein [Phycisphaerales bacterium]
MSGSIVELVRTQCALYEELLALGAKQRELVHAGDGAGVMEVVTRRGAIIERLAALQGEADARGGIDACVARESRGMPGIAAEVARHRARVAEIGARLARDDAEDIESLREASGEVAAELDRVGSGRRAVGAYSGAGSGAGMARFQDRRA